MSKKALLNVTSIKKRDTMLPYSITGSAGTPSLGAYNIAGGNAPNGSPAWIFPWIATARDNSAQPNLAQGNKFTTPTRSATTCFMRGLKEAVEIQTSSGLPWQWRRVCFCLRDVAQALGYPTGTYSGFLENSNGFVRPVYNATSNSTADAATLNALRSTMFKGQLNNDWLDYMTAPLDSTRIDIKYDRTRTIASGNASGCIRKFKMWHPMNKNLVYDDDETSGLEAASYYSTGGKQGMGDYYVVDFFMSGKGAVSSTDVLSFEPQATLYWHEK